MSSTSAPGAASALYQGLIHHDRFAIAAYFLLLLLAIGLQTPIPFLLSSVVDGLSRGIGFGELAPRMLGILGLSLGAMLLSIATQIASARLNMAFLLRTRLTVYRALQHAPLRFAKTFDVSDLHARFMGDLNTLQHILPSGLANVARHLLCILVFGSMLIYISPAVVLWIVWLLPVAAGMFMYAKPRLAVLGRQAHADYARTNATVFESLSGLRESRITGSHAYHHARLHRALSASEQSVLRVRSYSACMFGGLGLIPIVVTALIWLVGGWQISAGELTVGALVSFILVLSLLYGPINGLFGVASGYVYEREAFQRVAQLHAGAQPLVRTPRPHPGAGAPPLSVELELRELSFAYGGEQVLHNFSAFIPGGACASLTGANGTGKSTLVALICGLEEPSAGAVLLNGVPLSAADADHLPEYVGYLPQDAFIFADTLRLNITLGRPIADARIHEAIAELGLGAFLNEWPLGLDTAIQEAGRNLSGGQRQKIALLRAVVTRPALLILDEPENNLDQEALGGLAAYLASIKGRSTTLLVSHSGVFGDRVDLTIDLSLARSDVNYPGALRPAA